MPQFNKPLFPRTAEALAQPVDALTEGIMRSQAKRAEAALSGAPELDIPQKLPVTSDTVRDAAETLREYQRGKAGLDERIVEEERWFRLRQWDIIRKRSKAERADEERPEPTSAWLFNSIANKHADLMDNFPEPNVLPRQRDDEADAKVLSSILPVIFERSGYEETYDKAGWYKLQHGVSAKGVFWDKSLEKGLGDVAIPFIDILNLFWEPGITDIQKSRNLFITALQHNDLLIQQYPQLKDKLGGTDITVKQYVYDDTVDISEMSVVVDWYYKVREGDRTVLHYCKFCGDTVLESTENDRDKYPNGIYAHGEYPVVLDVLFPEAGTPVGFGYIALERNPQLYIDKLDQVILESASMKAKLRYMAKKSAGINEEDFLDWSKPLIFYEGDKDNIIPLEVPDLPASVINVRQLKIDELKETSSNRDVSQGSSSGGVTAAAAIAALQEAGNKTSRDMINRSYRAFAKENYLAIEVVRERYDISRTFRIVGTTGHQEFISFSNADIKGKPVPPAYEAQVNEPDYQPTSRVPIFDIVVKPQKRSPYSKMAQNELAKELYQMGFFNPELADQSLAALDLMDFDGIEAVREKVQQGQTLIKQLMLMQQQMLSMSQTIYRLTGQAPFGFASQAQQGGGAKANPRKAEGKSMGSAQTDAAKANMTSYGQRLAQRASPDMNSG